MNEKDNDAIDDLVQALDDYLYTVTLPRETETTPDEKIVILTVRFLLTTLETLGFIGKEVK